MAKIRKKLNIKIDDITVELKPLTFEEKTEIQALLVMGGDFSSAMRATKESIRYSLKSVTGIEDEDGEEYQLEMVEGRVSDACLDELFNLELTEKLSTICMSLLGGIPSKFVHPETGEPLKGVSYIEKKGKKPAKK